MSREPVDPVAYAESERLYEYGRALLALGLKAEGDEVMAEAGRQWAIGLRGAERVAEIERKIAQEKR